jgi:hypothetical protein
VPHPEGPLLVFFALSQGVYLLVSCALATALLWRGLRGGRLPELLLGLHFALCLSLGYVLLVAGYATARAPGTVDPRASALLIALGQLVASAGVFANVAFTWRVFRAGERWALAWTAALGAALLAGHVGYGASGGFEHGRFAGGWYWLHYGAMIAAALWTVLEAFRYRRIMERRRAIGLGDPVVSNRFLLWGVGSLARVGMLLTGIAEVFLDRVGPEWRPLLMMSTLIASSLLGVVLAFCYGLTFFPTRGYLRRIAGRPAVGAT